jgi:capsular polysaccharide biosynthesis protein
MSDSILVAINSANLRVGQLTKERDMLKERMTAALATNASLTDYLAEKVVDLEGSIVQNQVLVETLQGTDPSAFFQLSASQQGASSIGPNRKMSVAVAGVLGLFVGVLLAFFIHYLISAREREATHKQT